MIFAETALAGAYVVDLERLEDTRGFFAPTWSAREFEARGLNGRLVECAISFNKTKGTLRGLHYQRAPYAQAKLISCVGGAIYDVLVDLRPGAPTFKRWIAVELTAANRRMLYAPEGVAHGFQTLTDETTVVYQMSEIHSPDRAAGVRWNDPAFGIVWPEAERIMIERDRGYPDFVT